MAEVTLSPKYQVVIPLEIRTALRLRPGQKIRAIRLDERIQLIPVKPLTEIRGFLAGIDTTIDRDPDRV